MTRVGNLHDPSNAGGQLTTTTDVENFPGFPKGILGSELTDKFREQSINMGCTIFTGEILYPFT